MFSEDLEFLTCQYADGTLARERIAEVEAHLRIDLQARECLESYRAIDGAMARLAGDAVPSIQWDRFQARINSTVLSLGASPALLSDEVEEQISRLADGNCTAAESALVEARLQAEPQARLVLSEYASLDRAMATIRSMPLPAVRWDAFASFLSESIAAEVAQTAPESYKLPAARPAANNDVRQNHGVWRIGRWMAAPSRLAIAACLLVAASVSFRLVGGSGAGSGPAVLPPQNPAVGTGSEVATVNTPPSHIVTPSVVQIGPYATPPGVSAQAGFANPNVASVDVQIGPPVGGADRAALADRYRDDLITRPSRSIVASDKPGVQDKDAKASRDTGPNIWR